MTHRRARKTNDAQTESPHVAPEAEISVLGAILIDDARALPAVIGLLTAESFQRESHRILYSSMVRLHRRGSVVDPVTLGEDLTQRGELEDAGGMTYIAELLDAVPTAANVEHHAAVVADRARRRQIHTETADLAAAIAADLEAGEREVSDVLARAQERIADLQRTAVRAGERLVWDEDVEQLPKPEFLIDDFIVRGGLHVLAGPPGHGKTFLALAWAYSIATGFRWMGREVNRTGPVVYVSAEGHAGLGARIRAWKRAQRYVGKVPVAFLPHAVNLADPSENARFLTDLGATEEPPALVVIDTFSRCFVGDENHQEDVAAFIAGADQIRQKVGSAVLILHHMNAGGERERGSTVLRGAADMLAFCKAEDGEITITCEKSKDAAPFQKVVAVLRTEGDSCIITPKNAWEVTASTDLSDKEREALQALTVGSNVGGLSSTAWQEVSKLPASSFHRAVARLIELGYARKTSDQKRAPYVITTDGAEAISETSHKPPRTSHGSFPKTTTHPGGSIEDPPVGVMGREVVEDLFDGGAEGES